MLRSIQGRERDSVIGKEEANKRINEIRDAHGVEYQELEAKYNDVRSKLGTQIDQL